MALFCFCLGLSPFALVTSIASVSFFTCHFAIKFVVLSSTFQLLSIRLFISKLFSIVGNALLFCYCCDCNVCTRIGCAARLLWRVYFLYSSFVSLSRTHTHTLVLIIRQRRTVNLILNSPEQPRVVGSLRLSGTALGLRLKQFFFCWKRHQAAIIYSLLKQVGATLRCGVDAAIPSTNWHAVIDIIR